MFEGKIINEKNLSSKRMSPFFLVRNAKSIDVARDRLKNHQYCKLQMFKMPLAHDSV